MRSAKLAKTAKNDRRDVGRLSRCNAFTNATFLVIVLAVIT